ncbi:hypothetical protein VTO42DRAFT_2655 [Malbranchea cinnamomea]
MAPFFHAGSASHAKYFDIRLDDDYVVFRGNEVEASSAHLKGTVVLCLSEPLTIKHLRLRLTGVCRVSHPSGTKPMGGQRKHVREEMFLTKTWTFKDAGKGKTETLPADNYEFPFDIVLQGSLPESLEGLHDTWILYRFKAEIGRKYAKDIVVRKPLRIIRTLDPTDLELSHVMAIENIWPEKLEYSISTPNKAVIFGTSVRVDFRLVSLLKGLRMGQITTQLIETCDLTLPSGVETQPRTHKTTRVIMTNSFEVDTDQELQILNEEVEGYQFSKDYDLPKTLTRCVQDIDTKGIRIRHKLKFRVQLHNPDGHISELRASLPISIFISPHLPLGDDNQVIDASAQRVAFDLTQQAPPVYGEHQFDQLYSEVDPSGYHTPLPLSGLNTPLGSHSRNASMENVAAVLESQDLSASVLQSRLHSLQLNSSSTPASPSLAPSESAVHTPGSRRSIAEGEPSSPPAMILPGSSGFATPDNFSRRPSEEENMPSGGVTPYPQYSEVEDLSRVPSYTTAVRSVHRTQYDTDLPDYESATAGDTVPPRIPPPQTQCNSHNRWRLHRPATDGDGHNHHHRHHFTFPHRHHSLNHDHSSDTWLRIIQARARS